MKKYILLIGLIGLLINMLGLTSCAPDYQTEFEVKTLVIPDKSQAPILFPLEGGEKTAEVQTNVALANWSTSSNSKWLTVDKKEGQVVITAGANDTYAPRTARVTIEYGHQAYYIDVTQTGRTPILLVEGERDGIVKSITANEATISVQVKSNMVLESDHILIPDTAAFIHIDAITDVEGSVDEKKVTFKIERNIGRKVRYGTITFQSSDNYNHTSSFLITQAEMLFTEIPLNVDMLSTNAQQPTEGPIKNLVDGNADTYFHSLYSTAISEMHYFQVTLDEPIEGCIFWYQNRKNSNGKSKDVSIMVSADGESWSEMAHIISGLPTGSGSTYESAYLEAEEPFKYFRFVVNATNDGAGPRFFNMAEFKMYKIQN